MVVPAPCQAKLTPNQGAGGRASLGLLGYICLEDSFCNRKLQGGVKEKVLAQMPLTLSVLTKI